MGSFSSALSGLNSASVDLSVISNDLANMNTVGYKSSDANFQDLFYQQVGSSAAGNPQEVGSGVTVGSISSNFTEGTISATGVPTDVAVDGQGYFVVNKDGEQEFTRAGNFSIASNGDLLASDGGQVMGYPAVNGVVNSNQTVAPLTIPAGLTVPAKASSQFSLTVSLNSAGGTAVAAASQQTGSGIAPATVLKTGSTLNFTDGTNAFTYTSAAGDTLNSAAAAINANANYSATIAGNSLVVTAKSGQAVTFSANTLTDAATSTQSEAFAISGTAQQAGTFSTPVTVYDALGGTHVLTATFTKTASNTWSYALTIPASDVGQTGNPVTVKSGMLTFNGNGQLTSPTGTVAVAVNNLSDGATNMTLNWNLTGSTGSGLLTQVAGPSSTYSTQTDGYSSGSLQTFSVAGDGTIQGVFSNGATLALGQLALASFTNSQGLLKNGSNSYLASLSSGQPTIGAPKAGGLGSITGGSLEQSNVDIATEFSHLILAQRDYQANAQTVTTLDQVSQYAINMIQNG